VLSRGRRAAPGARAHAGGAGCKGSCGQRLVQSHQRPVLGPQTGIGLAAGGVKLRQDVVDGKPGALKRQLGHDEVELVDGAVDFSQALFQFGTHAAVLCYDVPGRDVMGWDVRVRYVRGRGARV